jgi:hypothetical protein
MQKKKGKFQHSSFLAGGATSAAGRLVVENGTLKVCIVYSQSIEQLVHPLQRTGSCVEF